MKHPAEQQVSTLKTKKFQTLGLVVSSFLRVPFFPPYNGITVSSTFHFSKEQHRSVDQSWTMIVEHALFHLSRPQNIFIATAL